MSGGPDVVYLGVVISRVALAARVAASELRAMRCAAMAMVLAGWTRLLCAAAVTVSAATGLPPNVTSVSLTHGRLVTTAVTTSVSVATTSVGPSRDLVSPQRPTHDSVTTRDAAARDRRALRNSSGTTVRPIITPRK